MGRPAPAARRIVIHADGTGQAPNLPWRPRNHSSPPIMKSSRTLALGLATALSAAIPSAFATEGPVGAPNGADGFLAGALPPAGTYNLFFANYYRANRFNDSHGDAELPGFSETAKVFADKVLHMTDTQFLGGQVGIYGAAAVAAVDLNLGAIGQDTRTGLLDPEGGVIVGWHAPELHWYGLATVVVPFGSYDKTRLINLSNGYTTFRPQFGISWLPASGLDMSARLTYSFNNTNKATDYKSGQWMHADFNVGYPIGAGFKAGLQGYYMRQTTDDKKAGATVGDGNRARALGIGPGVIYQSPSGISVETRYLMETAARNHTQGDSLWVKAVWKF